MDDAATWAVTVPTAMGGGIPRKISSGVIRNPPPMPNMPEMKPTAALMVKGLSIAEIAKVRGSAEGTVKAHLNAIYRKAEARNRAEVLSNIMDSLIGKPLLGAAPQ